MHTVERWTALKAGCQRTLGRWRPWPRPFLVTPLLVRSVETSQRAEQVGCSRHYCAPRFLTDGNQGRRIAVQNVCQRPIQRENDLRWKSKALQKNKQKKKKVKFSGSWWFTNHCYEIKWFYKSQDPSSSPSPAIPRVTQTSEYSLPGGWVRPPVNALNLCLVFIWGTIYLSLGHCMNMRWFLKNHY